MNSKTKIILSLILISLITSVTEHVFSQTRYLKIKFSDEENDYVSFPPDTKFELKNENNEVVFSNEDKNKTFKIDKAYTLTVFPSWKKSKDIFQLKSGSIEQPLTSNYIDYKVQNAGRKKKELNYDSKKYSNGLKMKKTLKKSSTESIHYNAEFEFSNGVTAKYDDGEMTAEQNNKTLEIKGKYLIYCSDGLIKLSYNPKTGISWWVFEPKD